MRVAGVAGLCAALCAAAGALAQGGGGQAQAPKPDAAQARSNMLARTGGLVEREGEGPVLLFLNMQSKVPEGELADVPGQLSKVLRSVVALKGAKAPRDPVAALQAQLKDRGVAAVVGVCDVPSLPSLLVAPEARWALVNVAALAADKPAAAALAARVRKEQWRAFAHLMGAADSDFEHCLMKPVHSLADLDALTTPTVCPEPLGRVIANAGKLGVRTIRTATYRKACEEGWAPAPTNDFQRAIWEELGVKN
jgi:hypothetical protein